MRDWRGTLVHMTTPILDAMRVIDCAALQIALVVDEELRLLGVLTDGDIRRGILRGISLEQSVSLIMSKEMTTVSMHASREEVLFLMKQKDLRQVPVLDDRGRVVDLRLLADQIEAPIRENWVILMAGGLGRRLQPLTNDCPKPLLEVGGKPVLETILEDLASYGFRRYFISVNYKGDMIRRYVGDGSRWGIRVDYLEESRALGTAGALSLLRERPEKPFVVMNADLLTKVNFNQLLDYHCSHKAAATMCVRDYRLQVPFGVVSLDQQRIRCIDEKPSQRFLVSAGIYVLDPAVLAYVPRDTFFDMPSLFQQLIGERCEAIAFPIREYWIDVGRADDLEQAMGDFSKEFGREENSRKSEA